MDMYIYCLVNFNYIMLIKSIIEYLEETLHEHIEYETHYQGIFDYIGCSFFDIFIESEYTSNECESEFTFEDYQVSTNVSLYIAIFTDKIIDSISVLKKMIKRLEELFHTNIIVLNAGSRVVYISSSSKYYIDKSFWNQKNE